MFCRVICGIFLAAVITVAPPTANMSPATRPATEVSASDWDAQFDNLLRALINYWQKLSPNAAPRTAPTADMGTLRALLSEDLRAVVAECAADVARHRAERADLQGEVNRLHDRVEQLLSEKRTAEAELASIHWAVEGQHRQFQQEYAKLDSVTKQRQALEKEYGELNRKTAALRSATTATYWTRQVSVDLTLGQSAYLTELGVYLSLLGHHTGNGAVVGVNGTRFGVGSGPVAIRLSNGVMLALRCTAWDSSGNRARLVTDW